MKLTKLSLANFRGFEQLDIHFNRDVTVIAGENGVGKSSILYALARLLSYVINNLTVGKVPNLKFSDTDVRIKANGPSGWLQVSGDFSFSDKNFSWIASRSALDKDQKENIQKKLDELGLGLLDIDGDSISNREKKIKRIKREIVGLNKLLKGGHDQVLLIAGGFDVSDNKNQSYDLDKAFNNIKHELKNLPNQPIAVYYTTKRFFNDSFKAFPKTSPYSVAQAYSNALDDLDVSLKIFAHWFRSASKSEQGSKIAIRMTEVISEFIPEFGNLRLSDKKPIQFFVDKAGVTLPLTSLSDGERGLIAMVFDLTRRLSLANPWSKNPIGEGQAIVLIDEIELHLHPKWQRQVLRRLRDAFPNCQFIVTTHSPQVLGEVEAHYIRFLERNEETEQVDVYRPKESYGLDANRVLGELMGAPERSKQVAEDLNDLFQLIDDEKFEEAREAMKPLSKILGDQEPELTRAEALIKFLEGVE